MFNKLARTVVTKLVIATAAITLSGTLVAAPKLLLYATGGTTIHSGQTTVSVENLTDFGPVEYLGGANAEHYFYIKNMGPSSNLQLGQPAVTITQSGSDFTLTPVNLQTLPYYGYTYFSIMFNPSGVGVNNATVHVSSNDPTSPDYNFAIRGSGTQVNVNPPKPNLYENTMLLTKKKITTHNGQSYFRCKGTIFIYNDGLVPSLDGSYLMAYADADGFLDSQDVPALKPVKIKPIAPKTGITRTFKFKIPVVPTDSLIMHIVTPIPDGDSNYGNNNFFGNP